jgi:small subunit ribosomal protein S16
MVIIRFVRVGRRNQAFFHLVAAEKSRAVQKKYIEKLGYYNPHSDAGKGELVFNETRVKYFLGHGAQMSETAARLLSKQGCKEAGKFVHERPTKPKKETPPPKVSESESETSSEKTEIVEPAPETEVKKSSTTEETPGKEEKGEKADSQKEEITSEKEEKA